MEGSGLQLHGVSICSVVCVQITTKNGSRSCYFYPGSELSCIIIIIIIICLFSVTQQYMGTIEIKAEKCTVILFMMVVEDPIRETAEAQWLGIHRHIC